jgi:MoaE-MoaD fusion protein
MRLQVRLFGGLAAHAGASRIDVEVAGDATAADLPPAVAEQVPAIAGMLSGVKVAVDLEVATPDLPLAGAGEVALLPPVAGGADGSVQAPRPAAAGGPARLPAVVDLGGVAAVTGLLPPPLPVEAALAAIGRDDVGGIVSFLGTVRDHAPDLPGVVGLDYSAYPEMAEKVLADIATEIVADHPQVRGVTLLHAVGELSLGEHTILVACAAAHRGPAFDACRDALERVKDRTPVWKRERTADGASRWVGLHTPDG